MFKYARMCMFLLLWKNVFIFWGYGETLKDTNRSFPWKVTGLLLLDPLKEEIPFPKLTHSLKITKSQDAITSYRRVESFRFLVNFWRMLFFVFCVCVSEQKAKKKCLVRKDAEFISLFCHSGESCFVFFELSKP